MVFDGTRCIMILLCDKYYHARFIYKFIISFYLVAAFFA